MRHAIEHVLTRSWLHRGLIAIALWPLSLLFRVAVALRRGLYSLGLFSSIRLPVPVIVIGNIFVGGTGKTPLVIWLACQLREAGWAPGIISRGYGAGSALPKRVESTASPADVGDEPLLIARRTGCPVVVCRNRVAAGRTLLEWHPEVDVILSDDGLQHYALQRDVEIALFDERGLGNGWMLPAGPLREPASRRRDFTVVNGEARLPAVGYGFRMRLEGRIAEHLVNRAQQRSLAEMATPAIGNMRPPKILAAAGIGNPSRFFSLLRAHHLVFEELPLPDHFDYKISPFIDKDADIILITEKDAVKCALFEPPENLGRFWVVPVTARIDNALAMQIMEMCRGSRTA